MSWWHCLFVHEISFTGYHFLRLLNLSLQLFLLVWNECCVHRYAHGFIVLLFFGRSSVFDQWLRFRIVRYCSRWRHIWLHEVPGIIPLRLYGSCSNLWDGFDWVILVVLTCFCNSHFEFGLNFRNRDRLLSIHESSKHFSFFLLTKWLRHETLEISVRGLLATRIKSFCEAINTRGGGESMWISTIVALLLCHGHLHLWLVVHSRQFEQINLWSRCSVLLRSNSERWVYVIEAFWTLVGHKFELLGNVICFLSWLIGSLVRKDLFEFSFLSKTLCERRRVLISWNMERIWLFSLVEVRHFNLVFFSICIGVFTDATTTSDWLLLPCTSRSVHRLCGRVSIRVEVGQPCHTLSKGVFACVRKSRDSGVLSILQFF